MTIIWALGSIQLSDYCKYDDDYEQDIAFGKDFEHFPPWSSKW
jgi:hypothetical protein